VEAKCKLCRCKGKLCNSHAIPDSLFKAIFRGNSGKAIKLSSLDEKPIEYTHDSWATEQLCEACERKLNKNYELYSLKALSGKNVDFTRLDDGVLFESIDTQKICDFIVAILWRASISESPNYKAIELSKKLNESIRLSLNISSSVSKRKVLVRGFKLIDTVKGGFTRENLRNFISSPFLRNYSVNEGKSSKVVCLVFLGYMFEVFINSYPKDNSYRHEFIGFDKKKYKFKFQEITEIPELFDLMVQNLSKHIAGHSKIKC
jgi:hypothetical protein